jgi:DNA gyrase subunit A
VSELKAVREQVRRRAAGPEIVDESGELRHRGLIADEDMAITVTNTGYIKRTPISTYPRQRRGGKGTHRHAHSARRTTSAISSSRRAHAYIMIFTGPRRAYLAQGPRGCPDVGPDGKGKAIVNLGPARGAEEKIAALLAGQRNSPEQDDQQFVVMGTPARGRSRRPT